MSLRELQHAVFKIFMAGVQAVCPEKLVSNALNVTNNKLVVKEREYNLHNNVYVIAFGKAVYGMVQAVENVLGSHIVQGVASVPYGIDYECSETSNVSGVSQSGTPTEMKNVEIISGAKDNYPDEKSEAAAMKIMRIAQNVGSDDILLVLVSGGGSALLPLPVTDITLEEKIQTTKILSKKGASIFDLNTVRKHLSQIKGGKLAEAAYPAKVITLILSDVLGDPLDIIACGPTVPDTSTKHDGLHIIEKLNAVNDVPTNVLKYLASDHGVSRQISDYSHVQNVVIGNNKVAAEAAAAMAKHLGFKTFIHSTDVTGEARNVGKFYADLGAQISENRYNFTFQNKNINDFLKHSSVETKPICILGAGETTVSVQGSGLGGRNQELALAASKEMHKLHNTDKNMILLSAGTDGQDGPTLAAGAYAFPQLVTRATSQGLDAVAFLNNNDSFTFYNQLDNGEYLLKTGLTGTNVMDLQILAVSSSS